MRMEKLHISENGRYFEKADGSPFVWLADTAWTVPARLKWDDVLHYMETRKKQGFTVLQMVVLDPEFNEEMRNPCGIKALKEDDLLQPEEQYFSYVDWVLDQAEAYGFYVLLLPVWGELVVGWDWNGGEHPLYMTEQNAAAYGKWLGRRMAGRNNILWCLGGDRMHQMKTLRDFMEAYDLSSFEPCQERLLRQSAAEDDLDLHEQAAVDIKNNVMLVYFASDTEEQIDLKGVMKGKVYQAWFDPKNGQLTETAACTLPDPDAILTVRNSLEEDRLLILADEAAKISVPQRTYFETRSEEEARKVFEW